VTETKTKLVAILAANPALTSILAKPLATEAGLRICEFATGPALVTFMRISPLDLVIIDADSAGTSATDFVRALRANPRLASAHFDIIALTRAAPGFHQHLLEAGIDEVLSKPVSTIELLDRVALRLAHNRPHAASGGIYGGPERRLGHRARQLASRNRDDGRPSNVIPLFGRTPSGIASKG
jgi:DNA-binding response OmpR family regulator